MALVLTDSGEKLEITAIVVIPFTVHYADYVGATPVFTPGVTAGDTLNGTKDLLVAPGLGQRVVRTITIHNDSGGADTITVQLDDGGVNYTITTVSLPDGYTLCYDEDGWHVLDSGGAMVTVLPTHAILGSHHSDAATDAVSQGSLIFGNATPAWDELVHPGAANRVLQSSAAEVVWSANAVTFPTAGAVPAGSGANTQVAYWTAANTLAGDAGLTYNSATDSLTIAGNILMADGKFIGIGAAVERITFNAAGNIRFSDCNVAVGTAGSSSKFHISQAGNSGDQLRIENTLVVNNIVTLGTGDAGLINHLAWMGSPYGINAIADFAYGILIGLYGQTDIALRVKFDNNILAIVKATGNVGIAVVAPLAQLHVDQSSTTAAKPVLLLDQADLSEEFIELTTTVGAGNPIDTAALGSYYGKMRVNVTGVGYKYIALYDS